MKWKTKGILSSWKTPNHGDTGSQPVIKKTFTKRAASQGVARFAWSMSL